MAGEHVAPAANAVTINSDGGGPGESGEGGGGEECKIDQANCVIACLSSAAFFFLFFSPCSSRSLAPTEKYK